MKKLCVFVTIALGLTACMNSCSKPTNVAEEALMLAGKGTFIPTAYEKRLGVGNMSTIGLFTDYGNIFDNALIQTQEAEEFLKNGYYNEIHKSVYFDFSDIMFSDYRLIRKEEVSFDLKDIVDFSKFDGFSENEKQTMMSNFKKMYEDYQEKGSIATWTSFRNVPSYNLRYNIENKYIINIIVVDIPSKGYRVCSYQVE